MLRFFCRLTNHRPGRAQTYEWKRDREVVRFTIYQCACGQKGEGFPTAYIAYEQLPKWEMAATAGDEPKTWVH